MLIHSLHQDLHLKLDSLGTIVQRPISFFKLEHKIDVAIGMRRSGKTYLLFTEMKALLKQGISLDQLLYLNFEDDRLIPLDATGLATLIEEFYSAYPENHARKCYLFLDEIQNVQGWPNVIRRFLDTKNVQLFLTGSSSKLLSKEIATSLRGRALSTEVFPYDLTEYADANSIALTLSEKRGKVKQDQFQALLKTMLLEGGFPEVQGPTITLEARTRILQEYVQVAIFRDVVERYHITNTSLIHYLIKTILGNVGTLFSANKFFRDCKSQGYKLSIATIHDYLHYLADAYLLFLVPILSDSIRKTQSNPRKIYGIDTGLATVFAFHNGKNCAQLFENRVFLDLRRRQLSIHYYLNEDRTEVDFHVKNLRGEAWLIQVSWDLSLPTTLQREESALKTAKETLGIDGMIVTPVNYTDFIQEITKFSQL